MTAVPQPSRYRIGAATTTIDGQAGTVCALVVDPHTRTVTHLAVEPAHHHHQARLVPTEIADASSGGTVQIACSDDTFERLDLLEQLEVVEIGPHRSDWLADIPSGFDHIATWTDQPPEGERALRRRTAVHTDNGTLGHLDGLLAGNDGRIVAILVARGHLWRHWTGVIPIDAVTRVDADDVAVGDAWVAPSATSHRRQHGPLMIALAQWRHRKTPTGGM